MDERIFSAPRDELPPVSRSRRRCSRYMIHLLCLDTWTSRSIAQRQEAKRKDGHDVEDARDPELLAQSARCVSAARLRGARRSTHVRAALVPGWYLKMPV
jgi:hypothetical protein